jgi:hypothetical protein
MKAKIKMIDNQGALSEGDLSLLRGTPTLLSMMRNRRLLVVTTGYEPDWEALTQGITGLYHIRNYHQKQIFQIWFEKDEDVDKFEKSLFLQKLSV